MRILVIGLGSMGQRRIRNLRAISNFSISGMDSRLDRCKRAEEKYSIVTYPTVESAMLEFKPDAFIISTPPDKHMDYAFFGFEHGVHCFVEASVTDADKIEELNEKLTEKNIIIAPSCTMKYFPGPRVVKEILDSNAIGEVKIVNYQVGQYLPDWHPWESIQEYYVSKRETGGAREIVPFELTWLNSLFGEPNPMSCTIKKLSDFGADIDDYYQFLIEYDSGVMANIQIEVLSRPRSTRELRIIGSEGQLVYSGESASVRLANLKNPNWELIPLPSGTVQSGYINPEEPYISEMRDFLNSVRELNQDLFPNNLHLDSKVLRLLYKLEEMANARG
jgi:predicted dehydrogenase